MNVADAVKRVAGENPFMGLRPFGPGQADLFFGRDVQTANLLNRLAADRFLAVVGASGSGKSSLVFAGLVARLLQADSGGARWRIATMRPGLAPIEALAMSLADPRVLGTEQDEGANQCASMRHSLERGYLGLVELCYQARLAPDEHLLVIVDQFEQLFRYTAGNEQAAVASEAAAFIKLLLTAAAWKDVRINVVVTMRSDYLGDCARFPDLTEVIYQGLALVPRMTRDELQSAVEGPVNRVEGALITPQLVSVILNDVGNLGNELGQLPVLQHALMRTWNYWHGHHVAGEPLDLAHYEHIGQVAGALEQHAEAIYGDLDSADQAITERLFRCVTTRDAERRSSTRPTPFEAACKIAVATSAELTAVLERFNDPGVSFLTPGPPPPYQHDVIDLAHESLMRLWKRLAGWADKEARAAETYSALVADAAEARTGWFWSDARLALGLARLSESDPAINAPWAARYDAGLAKRVAELEQQRAAPAGAGAPAADDSAVHEEPLYDKTSRERFAAAMKFLSDSAEAPQKKLLLEEATRRAALLKEEQDRRAALLKEEQDRRAAADAANNKRRLASYAGAAVVLLIAAVVSLVLALTANQKMTQFRTLFEGARAGEVLNRAYEAQASGRHREAVGTFTDAIDKLKSVPNSTLSLGDAFNYQGLSYQNLGVLDKAIADYNQAITLYRTVPLGVGIADAYSNRASAHLRQARKLSTGAVSADAEQHLNDLYKRAADDAGAAIESYVNAKSPESAGNAYYNRGLARQWIVPPNDRAAIRDLTRAIELYGGSQSDNAADAHQARAQSWAAVGNTDRAFDDYTAAIKLKELPAAMAEVFKTRAAIGVALGDRRFSSGDFAGATASYRLAVRDYRRAGDIEAANTGVTSDTKKALDAAVAKVERSIVLDERKGRAKAP